MLRSWKWEKAAPSADAPPLPAGARSGEARRKTCPTREHGSTSREPPHIQARNESSKFSDPQTSNSSSYRPMRSKKARSTVKRPPAMAGVATGAASPLSSLVAVQVSFPANGAGLSRLLPPPLDTHRKLRSQSKAPRIRWADAWYAKLWGWMTSITGATIVEGDAATRCSSGSSQRTLTSTCASRNVTVGAVVARKPRRRERTTPSRLAFVRMETLGETARTEAPTGQSDPSSTMTTSCSSCGGERPITDVTVRLRVTSASFTSTMTTAVPGKRE